MRSGYGTNVRPVPGSRSHVSLKLTTNKKKTIVHFSCREREKKHKQLITGCNPIMICLHVPHHVKEGMAAHLFIQRMTIFDHQEASHAPP
jgi:hypothetical protein